MKSRAPTDSELSTVRHVVEAIEPDQSNARLITLFAFAEKFALICDDFSLAHFAPLAKHEAGDVAKALRLANIATGHAGNSVASTAGVEALNAARAKLDSMFGTTPRG